MLVERSGAGQPLPTLPLWLSPDLVVPLDLEPSYERAWGSGGRTTAFTCRAGCKERVVSKNRNAGPVKCNALLDRDFRWRLFSLQVLDIALQVAGNFLENLRQVRHQILKCRIRSNRASVVCAHMHQDGRPLVLRQREEGVTVLVVVKARKMDESAAKLVNGLRPTM